MKKNLYILGSILITIASCSKKEATLPAPGTFANIIFSDPFDIGPFTVHYQEKPITSVLNSPTTVLPGEGKFEFFNAAGVKVLEKKINVNKDIVKTYVIFKPDPNIEAVQLVENTQGSEPKPTEDHIKVKAANFAQSIFGNKNIKIVFNQNNLAVDTIQTTGTDYTNSYSEMPRAFTTVRGQKRITYSYQVTFLDESNQQILNDSGLPMSIEFATNNTSTTSTIFTLFIAPNPNNHSIPRINALFEN